MELPIYMDYNATTPVDPRVLEAMLPYFTEHYGNAASHSHSFGWKAEAAVDAAREEVAGIINAETPAREIVFTSGATESNNLAILGLAEMYGQAGGHIITCQTEHRAVLDPCEVLAKRGFEITFLQPDEFGMLTVEQVAEAITDRTILVTIMAANNETGVLHPIAEIGQVVRQARQARPADKQNLFFHTDATQAIGKLPVDIQEMGIDLLSLSAHKVYGPKGVGALYVRRRGPRVRLSPRIHGGGHEHGMRSGTLNTPGIVGLGAACRIAREEMAGESARLAALRDRLEEEILRAIPYVRRNGHPTERLANTANLAFGFVEGEGLMLKMRDIAVSSGSACTSADLGPSFVLSAMGVSDMLSHGSIRFSLGRFSHAGDIDFAVEKIVTAVAELREISPLYDDVLKNGDDGTIEWTKPAGQ
ncbi:MAG: IscS subfamily cysteine desulfurase [Phycisphaerae bacterium]|nr:IscS subfamily cysteine desulfurase [Phycisphaerae bacterium]